MMQVFLETDRLVLRQFTLADADNLVNLDADPDVMRFVTGGISTSREEIEDEVLPAFLGYYQRYEGYGFWAAIEKATGEFLGWFHFRPRDGAAPGEAEFGYRVRKSAWGWPYPIDATSSAGWSTRWTRPDGSRTSPPAAQPDRRAPRDAHVRSELTRGS